MSHLSQNLSPLKTVAESTRFKDYEQAFEYSCIGLCLVGFNATILHVNPKMCEMLGYEPSELESKKIIEITHPDFIESTQKEVQNLVSGYSDKIDITKKVIKKNSEPLWVHVVASIIRNEKGEPQYIFSQLIDIHDQKVKDLQAKKNKESLDLALESAEYGAWDWNLQTNEVNWDDRQYKLYNIDKEEFKNAYSAFESFLHPDDKKAVWEATQKAINEKVDYYCKFRIIHPHTKEIRFLAGRGKVIYSKDGTPLRMTGLNWDCTDDFLNEKKLRESEERFKQAFAHSAIGIALVSPKGQLFQINKAFCSFMGYSEQEMLNLDFQTITHPDDLQKDLEYLKQLELGKINNYQMEKRYFTKDGKTIWIQLNASAVRDVTGKVVHYIAQVQNIDEAKKAKHLIELKNQQLTEVNEDLERFAYVASHDLQEPLRKIRSFLEILEKDIGNDLSEQQKKYFGFVVDGAGRMRQLIVDLLDYSRAGQKDLNLKELDVSSLIQTALTDLELAIQSKGTKVEFDPKKIKCHTTPMLERVFHNILSNAIKFNNSSNPTIWIDMDEQDDCVVVSIKDNGIGMDEKEHRAIFEIFRRLHSRSAYPGTGIGLAITKKIIDRIHGELIVESKVNEGATFKVKVPKTSRRGEK